MITCTATVFEHDAPPGDDGRECGEPATQLVTITGADRARGMRPESTPTPWNLEKAPRCDQCARMDRGIATRMFDGATFDSEPIPAGA